MRFASLRLKMLSLTFLFFFLIKGIINIPFTYHLNSKGSTSNYFLNPLEAVHPEVPCQEEEIEANGISNLNFIIKPINSSERISLCTGNSIWSKWAENSATQNKENNTFLCQSNAGCNSIPIPLPEINSFQSTKAVNEKVNELDDQLLTITWTCTTLLSMQKGCNRIKFCSKDSCKLLRQLSKREHSSFDKNKGVFDELEAFLKFNQPEIQDSNTFPKHNKLS
ncbi:hypothetical protein HMI56_000821, partial [Coelomomyces lativittatus]